MSGCWEYTSSASIPTQLVLGPTSPSGKAHQVVAESVGARSKRLLGGIERQAADKQDVAGRPNIVSRAHLILLVDIGRAFAGAPQNSIGAPQCSRRPANLPSFLHYLSHARREVLVFIEDLYGHSTVRDC